MRDVIHQLQAGMMGALLPSIKFFEPVPAFFEYLDRDFPGLPIIDVGAGMGQLAKALDDRGRKVFAIDLCERENTEYPVYIGDALIFPYPQNCLPIIARPCHGLWLEHAIDRALECVPVVLYVGLRKNIEGDLGGLPYKLKRHDFKAGKAGEIVIELTKGLRLNESKRP